MVCKDDSGYITQLKQLQELIRRWDSEITAIMPFKIIQGHRFWYKSTSY